MAILVQNTTDFNAEAEEQLTWKHTDYIKVDKDLLAETAKQSNATSEELFANGNIDQNSQRRHTDVCDIVRRERHRMRPPDLSCC